MAFKKGLVLLFVSGSVLFFNHAQGSAGPVGAALFQGIRQEASSGAVTRSSGHAKGPSGEAPRLADMAEDLEKRLEHLKKRWDRLTEDLRQSEAFKKIQEDIRKLYEDMKKAEGAAREKLEKEVLPKLKRELKKLKDKLRGLDREEEQEETRPVPI